MPRTRVEGKSPGKVAWERFRKNRIAMASAAFLIIAVLLATFAYLIIPDKTRNANFQCLELARKPPGTHAVILLRPTANRQIHAGFFSFLASGNPDLFEPILLSDAASVKLENGELSYRLSGGLEEKEKLDHFLGSHTEIDEQSFKDQFMLERTFLLGTDGYGRDMQSRLILGTRVSLAVGFISVLISLLVGLVLGALAGFFGGKVDAFIMWLTSVVWSIPTLLLAISLTFVWEKGFWQVFIAIGLSMWVEVARIVRGQIFFVRETQFVEAARALGFPSLRTLFLHVIPNVLNPVIIVSAANFASAILVEAGLSFLGVGVQAPVPSWGGMIREGYSYIIFENGKWMAIFPGLAIVLVVISLNLVGFGLRDALDPKATR